MEDENKKNNNDEVKAESSESPGQNKQDNKPDATKKTSYTYEISSTVNYITPVKRKYKKAITAKRIAIASVIVNAVLAFLTWLLFRTASSQANSAINAATIAGSTLKATRDYNTKSLNLQQDAFISNNTDAKNREIREKLSSASQTKIINAQIASFKEQERQFKNQNETFLQAVISEKGSNNNNMVFSYIVYNLSNSPAKIITKKTWFKVSEVRPIFNSKNIRQNKSINTYAIKGIDVAYTSTFAIGDKIEERSFVENTNSIAYYKAEYSYINLVTNEIRKYEFEIKIRSLPNFQPGIEVIKNENTTIKNGVN